MEKTSNPSSEAAVEKSEQPKSLMPPLAQPTASQCSNAKTQSQDTDLNLATRASQPPESTKTTRFTWKKLACAIAVVVLLFASPLLNGLEYWVKLVTRSFSEAWMLVFEKTWAGLALVGISWAIGIWQTHREKWRTGARLELLKIIAALKLPVGLLLSVFLIHLLVITPGKMNTDAANHAETLEGKIRQLEGQQTPTPVEVNVTSKNTDEDAQRQLKQAWEELAEARNQIRVLQKATDRLSPPILPNGQVKFGASVTGSPTNTTRELQLAVGKFNAKDYTNALNFARKAIEFEEASLLGITMNSFGLSTKNKHLMYYIGAWSAFRNGDVTLAHSWGTKAAKLIPEDFDTQKVLIVSSSILGKANEAQSAFDKAFQVSTNKPELRELANKLGLRSDQ